MLTPRRFSDNSEVERDIAARQTLLMSLGEFTIARMLKETQRELADILVPIYRDDPDPGLHSTVQWLLRKWGHSERLQEIDAELVGRPPGNRNWYLNRHGQTRWP